MSCLMNFGELNIPSSRAFWDDCEEDELSTEPPESLKLNFEAGQSDVPVKSDIFLIIEGPNVSDFAGKTLLNNTKKICKIPSKKSSLHFNNDKKHLLAVIDDDLVYSGEITQLLLPYAKEACEVITLTLKPKVEYKSEQISKYKERISIVRAVKSKLKNVKELETPNFIAGVAAGIATWREHAELPISSYVIYTDKLPLDAIASQPVLELFKKLGIDCATSYIPSNKMDSYLYL